MFRKDILYVYCIIRCLVCGHYQGSTFPVKTIKCKRCGKTYRTEKNGIIGTYGTQKEMQAHLIGMKWDDDSELPQDNLMVFDGSRTNRRKDLRTTLMETVGKNGSQMELLMNQLIELGFSRDDIHKAIEDLRKDGRLYSPRYGLLMRVS